MFNFGDDQSPSNDTVNVTEEILVEYIADVVSVFSVYHRLIAELRVNPVSNCPSTDKEVPLINRGFSQGAIATD